MRSMTVEVTGVHRSRPPAGAATLAGRLRGVHGPAAEAG